MGFSVSGTLVVVLFGLFVALGTFYTTGANTMERLGDAEADRADQLRDVREGGINVTAVEITDAAACDVGLVVRNTGSTALDIPDVDLLVDNGLVGDWRAGAAVDGDADTDLWLPGEDLVVNRTDQGRAPERVKVVTGAGVASSRGTGGLTCQ